MTQVTIEQAMRLGLEHHQAGRELPRPSKFYRQVLTHRPNHADALAFAGCACPSNGLFELDSAIKLIHLAIEVRPGIADYHNNLASVLRDKGQSEEAVAARPRSDPAQARLCRCSLQSGSCRCWIRD